MGNCCFGKHRDQPLNSAAANRSRSPSISLSSRSLERSLEQPFDPLLSCVEWNHESADTVVVGQTSVATVKFICHGGAPYQLKNLDHLHHTVTHEDDAVTVNSVVEPSGQLRGRTFVRVSFTPRKVGTYTVTFEVNQQRIGGKSYTRKYIAGPPVSGRTIIHDQTNHMIVRCGIYYTITISPRDAYGNVATINTDLIHMTVQKGGHSSPNRYPDCVTEQHYDHSKLNVLIKLDEPGYYVGSLNYEETVIGLQNCAIICLTEDGRQMMEQNIKTSFLNIKHKANLVPTNGSGESRKVKCFISPRLLQIRGQSLRVFSSRLFTCRVCNSTRFNFHEEPGKFSIDDGLQTPVTLISESREVIAAVFYSFIQRNAGGAESFQEKQRHFQNELQRLNPEINRSTTVVRVRRYNLLESAMYATRGFKIATWKSKFRIQFEGEDGIDVGGVSREFFTCICDVLFGGRNSRGLFTRFSDDPQGLVHPTAERRRDPSLGLHYFEFAGRIVGKCLFETAFDNPMFVKAHFTRSFLAQLIGLRISWKHFETDDPDLYRYKIEHIRESSLEELDLSLTFADEVVEDGRPASDPLMVSLHPGGSKQKVTDNNKMDYLNELARYRLVQNVSDEIRHFLKGLREFIPEELLVMFDENELELLVCGVQKLSSQDLKEHTEIRGNTTEFLRSVEWFWTAVSEFTSEELARLVQFVTGSSQIPPGGFAELRPPFLIVSSGSEYNRLPYSHTCFNHLCLPNYDTYEQFRRSLMTAINEGNEGVLLS